MDYLRLVIDGGVNAPFFIFLKHVSVLLEQCKLTLYYPNSELQSDCMHGHLKYHFHYSLVGVGGEGGREGGCGAHYKMWKGLSTCWLVTEHMSVSD